MKITEIKIDDYRQFKNIKFDFTYPEGHAKAGEPLEKVCFIGQSGTGKTTLLNIIWSFFVIGDDGYQIYSRKQLNRSTSVEPYRIFENVVVTAESNKNSVVLDNSLFENYKDNLFENMSIVASSVEWILKENIREDIENSRKLCLYVDDSSINHSYTLTANRIDNDFGSNNFVVNSNDIFLANEKREEAISKLSKSKIVALQSSDSRYLWSYILSDIDRYDENLKKIAIDLIQKNGSFSPNRLADKLSKWQEENPNPKVDIADNCLNPILSKFFLEVDIEGTEAPIVIKTKDGTSLTYNTLSTGTKQLLVTAIAIYKSQIESGVILFDEPERSLFPDIQRELVKYYTSLAPKAQFFYATHSPIIAAAFEPCERFILYFDENGQVKFHRGVAPEGDDPNDILRQDFDMSELMLEKGVKEYERYRRLGMEIREEANAEKKNQLIAERLELGNRYNFAGRNA
ncbi:AAA family ATPase [Spirosoma rhododendri]|uniref:AAA family ATPase n=1 Tax=Spirosoma rhododendri TaxID=2728024 RepID=A0A7L5DP08_9BACT|nr:AAA family ATPase [Spirosoma rhododendri]QJD78218.1 AAA family ATPase [Spirosoma rhododendri]